MLSPRTKILLFGQGLFCGSLILSMHLTERYGVPVDKTIWIALIPFGLIFLELLVYSVRFGVLGRLKVLVPFMLLYHVSFLLMVLIFQFVEQELSNWRWRSETLLGFAFLILIWSASHYVKVLRKFWYPTKVSLIR
jgi:hypothetical protein